MLISSAGIYCQTQGDIKVVILTGVSKSALSRIEKGEVALDLDVAEMIADGLHIGIDDLYESAVKHKKCPDIGTRQGKKRSGPFNH